MAGAALGERMAHAGPVGQMHARLARKYDGCDDRLLAVADGQRGRGAQAVGETPEHRLGNLLQPWPDARGERDQTGRECEASVRLAADEVVVGKWPKEAVHGSAMRLERRGKFSDRKAVGVTRERLERAQASVQRQ